MDAREVHRPIKMKDNDTQLDGLLQEWRVASALPPRFSEQVWKRIENADVPRISVIDALRVWFAMAFARPLFAFAYVSILITAGLALGFVRVNHQTAQWDRQLESRYLQSIDPYQGGR
jgi:hypothetical protein